MKNKQGLMAIEWFRVDNQDSDFPNRAMQVLVVFRPKQRGRRNQIRTAFYYRPDEWFVHGGSDDCGYYDHTYIAAWVRLPDMPGWR